MNSRLKEITVYFLLSMCIAAATGFGATGTLTVRGVVLAPDGTVLPGCRIIFSSNADLRKMIEYPIAASGTFVVSLMPAAGYNVRVMAQGYF